MKPKTITNRFACVLILGLCGVMARPAKGADYLGEGQGSGERPLATLKTPWAKDVDPETPWPEYPRPQLVRQDWLNLNGQWDYAIKGDGGPWTEGRVENAKFDPLLKLDREQPKKWDGQITVPYCVESSLSGVRRLVRPDQILWYRRTFELPESWGDRRVLLHFEAVDWHTIVWVNGKRVGEHEGGYDPFSFDITEQLTEGDAQQVTLAVWDPTNFGDQPVGKQALPELRRGFRYTPTTGIWQTVWLEPVAETSIERLKLTPDVDRSQLKLEALLRGEASGVRLRVEVMSNGKKVTTVEASAAEPMSLDIPQPQLWTPTSPHLYDLRATLLQGEKLLDEVESYFGMRKVSLGRDEDGINRIMLNDKFIFQYGPLDQGYWPDGILTPTTDDAAAHDVRYLKEIGCNMVRVHIKVHPRRWYYHCDRLGLIVWQDVPCTRKFDSKITEESARQFETEMRRMMDQLHNHPSVYQWILFNEAWGQYDTERLTEWMMGYDPSRLVTNASGWHDRDVGHIRDIHDYSFYVSVTPADMEEDRAVLLGEFGGFNVPTPGHMWHPDQEVKPRSDPLREGGRERYADGESFYRNYARWIESWRPLIGRDGLCAGVYTQISDVEHEPNGYLTYDRRLSKVAPSKLRKLHARLYQEPVRQRTVLANSYDMPQAWKYHVGPGADDWMTPGFDDSRWQSGVGPFAANARSDWRVGTSVPGRLIRMRCTFELDALPKRPALRVYAVKTGQAFINGELVKTFNMRGPRDGDVGVGLLPLTPQAAKALRQGKNTLALQSQLKGDTGYIDLGIVDLEQKE